MPNENYFMWAKGEAVKGAKGEVSYILLVPSAERDAPDQPTEETPRQTQITAYARAHQSWIKKFGVPTHEEAALLRRCYGIGVTTPDEWAVIAKHIIPESPFRAVHKDGFWRVIDNAGHEIPLGLIDEHGKQLPGYESRFDAWSHIDRLRGIKPPRAVMHPTVWEPQSPRQPEPRRHRGH
jgi:hypothetical protein